jgi:hypothetical protein
MTDQFEIFLNEQRADLAVFRITLTMFILRLVGQHPPSAEANLQGLKTSVLDAIGHIETTPADQGSERMKQMIAMRAENFFLELEEVVSETVGRMGETGKN